MTDFATFWDIARRWRGSHANPRKGRGGAEPAWDKCILEGADPEQVILGAKGYVVHIEKNITDLSMVCQATTFLNQWRFEQYVELARETAERAAADLLERRRTYYRRGRFDATQGFEPHKHEHAIEAVCQEAYDQGYREARPGLRVVGRNG